MDLYPTPEQDALSEMAGNAFSDLLPLSSLHENALETAQAAWPGITELGLLGVLVPEELGGVGLTQVEAGLIAYEAGRTLAPISLLWTIAAAHLTAGAGAEGICGQMIAGTDQTALHVESPAGALAAGLAGASTLLQVSADQATVRSFSTPPAARRPCLDTTTDLFDTGEEGDVIASVSGPDTYRLVSLLISAAQAGIARRVLDIAVDHGQNRIQFGKPIGAFQAVRHACAEMARRAEAARSMVNYAAIRLATGHDEAADAIAAASVISSDAAITNSGDTLQILGAMGMTAEHDLSLFLKRALLLDSLTGSTRKDALFLAAA